MQHQFQWYDNNKNYPTDHYYWNALLNSVQQITLKI